MSERNHEYVTERALRQRVIEEAVTKFRSALEHVSIFGGVAIVGGIALDGQTLGFTVTDASTPPAAYAEAYADQAYERIRAGAQVGRAVQEAIAQLLRDQPWRAKA